MKVFNVDKDHLTSELRRKAKAVNFGIIYGISDWGLAEQISSTPAEAKKIIATFYEQYPEIKEYFSSVIEQTKTLGYSSTLYGRRRYIPEINADNFQTREFGKRAAMNASIQGTGADIIKIAMIKINKFLKENHYQTKMVLQIHDELIFKIPQNEKSFIVDQLKNIMENCVSLKVKMKVEGSLGKTWYDCK
jgi:DNA polymerase-1